MNEHETIQPSPTSPDSAAGHPSEAPGDWQQGPPSSPRRGSILRRLGLGAAMAMLLLVATQGSTVQAFGDIEVRIGGFAVGGSALCAGVKLPPIDTGLPVSDPCFPDFQIIAGSQTAPHGPSTLTNHSPNFQDYEDRFVVEVKNNDLDPTNPPSEPIIFEYRAPANVYITGIQADIPGSLADGRCEIGTETDPAPFDVARCELGQLDPNPAVAATITIEFYVDLATGRETLLDHDVRVYHTPIGTENQPPDNQDHYFQNVTTRADLSVLKTGPTNPLPFVPNQMTAGTCETFTLTVHNDGPSVSREVFVADSFFAQRNSGMTITGGSVVDSPGGTCDLLTAGAATPQTLLCALGDVGPGEDRHVLVNVCADSSIPDGMNFANYATVGSGAPAPPLGGFQLIPQSILPIIGVKYPYTPEPCASLTGVLACLNNVTVLPVVVLTEADLAIEKSSEPDKVNAGEQKQYTIKVTNNGPSDALNVMVKDTLPPDLAYEIDDDNCLVRDRVTGGPDPFGYTYVDSLADRFLQRDGLQNDFRDPPGTGAPTTPIPLPYEVNRMGEPFFDISGSGSSIKALFAPNQNDGSTQVPLGFDFEFYDETESAVWVSTNGYLKFGSVSDTTDPDNDCPLHYSTPNRSIFVFWDDLDVAPGNVFVQTVADPNNPGYSIFIVQWETVGFAGDPGSGDVTFQVQLYEFNNQIRMVYGDTAPTPRGRGSSATIGIDPRFELADDPINGGLTYHCGDDTTPATNLISTNLVVVFNTTPEQDELICFIGEKVKEGSVPAYVEGLADTGCDLFDPLGCIFDLVDLNIFNDKFFTFPDGSSVTHVMKPGEMREIVVQALVDPAIKPGTIITNTAVVTGYTTLGDPTTMTMPDNFQPFGGNSMAFTKNLVLQSADLKVTKFGKPDGAVRAGDILTYTIMVDNLGPSWADNVAIKDLMQSSGIFDLIDINSDRRMVCNGLPGPEDVLIKPREWPLKDAPPAFGVDGKTGVEDIENRLELDCTLVDDPDTPQGDEPDADLHGAGMENRLETLAADGPPNSGRWIVTLRVRARETQDINNVVDVLSDAGDPDAANNHDEVEHDITDVADLSISKTDSGDPFVAGTEFEYFIEVENKGPSTAENVVVVDDLPLGLTVLEMSQPGVGSCATVQGTSGNTRVTCQLGTIPVGSTRRITLRVFIDPDMPEGSVLFNQAVVTSDIFDPTNHNNITRARSIIQARADIGVTKVDDPDPVRAGEILEYRIRVTNDGPSNARNVTVVDDLPADVLFERAEVVNRPGTCTSLPLGQVTCQLGTVTVDEVVEIAVVTRVKPDAACGRDIENEVEVSSTTRDPSPDPTPNQDQRQTRVNCRAGLEISKTASDDTPIAGSELRYTITVTNNGPSIAEEVRVRDNLPGDMTAILDTYGCGASLFGVGCDLGDLLPGETVTFDLIVELESDAECGSTLTNELWADSDTSDPVEIEREVVVQCSSDLWIRKFGKPDGDLRAGDTLRYTVLIDNLGPSDTVPGEVYFRDLLASDGTFRVTRIASSLAASCDPVGSLPFNGSQVGNKSLELECTLETDLNPNEQWRIDIDVTADAGQTLNNVADVFHAKSLDPNTDNNHAEVEHDISSVADLEIEKEDDDAIDPTADPFAAGEPITYYLAVTNHGPSPAENVVVVDTIPLGLSVQSISQPGQGSCALVQGVAGNVEITCHLGGMEVDEVQTIEIRVRTPSGMADGTVLWNEAAVRSDTFDDDNSNDISRSRSRIVTLSDLTIEKVDEPDPVLAGERLEYRIEVENLGPSDALDVVVSDALPAGLEVLSIGTLSGQGICQPLPAGQVTCRFNRLLPGFGETIIIQTRVDPAADCAVDLINTVAVSSRSPEPVPDPHANSDSRRTDVRCQASLRVEKRPSTTAPVAGSQLTYHIAVSNGGPSIAQDVVVRDVLPPDTEALFDTRGCGASLFGAGCQIGDLAPGETVSFDLVVELEPDARCQRKLTNTVTAASPDSPTALAMADVAVQCESDLRILKFGKPDAAVAAGEVLTYTLVVDNLGPSEAGGVFVKDIMQASGSFTVLDISSDRDHECVTKPLSLEAVPGRLEIDCTLDEPLEVLGDEGFPNPGRWILTVRAVANEAQSLNNVADVASSLARDPNPDNNRAVVEHAITDVADLSITKDDDDALEPFKAGEKFNYYLVVKNDGPSVADNVVVVDTLPLGLSVLEMTQPGTGSCSTLQMSTGNQRVTCNLSDMAVGEERTITIEVRVAADMAAGSILWNEAYVTSESYDDDNQDNVSRSRSKIGAVANLELTKTDSPDPVVAGETLAYTVTVRNRGPSVARNVVVRDDLPAGLDFLSAGILNGGGLCQPLPFGSVTCQLGDLPPDARREVAILARVQPEVACTSRLRNTARAESLTPEPVPDPHPNSRTIETTVACRGSLRLEKTVSSYTPVVGDTLVYSVKLWNDGPSLARDVRLTDALPAGLSYRFDTRGCGAALFGAGCAVGDLAPGQMLAFDIVVDVDPATACGSLLTNTITASSSTAATVAATAEARARCVSDLRVLKFGKPDGEVRAGEVLTYTVVIDNLGPSHAPSVFLKDIIQASGRFAILGIESDRDMVCVSEPVDWTGVQGRAEVGCTLNDPLETLEETGNFPNPGRWIITMRLQAEEGQSINNAADVSSIQVYDPDRSNNRAVVEHAFTDVADLVVSKDDDEAQEPFEAGTNFNYYLSVRNNGPSTAENVVLVDDLPLGLSVVSMSPPHGSSDCGLVQQVSGNPRVVCQFGTLAKDESRSVTIEVQVAENVPAGTILWNQATVTSDAFDDHNDSNIARERSAVGAVADLAIAKTDAPDPVVAGETLAYTVTVQNHGPSLARSVVVADDLPEGVDLVDAGVLDGAGLCQPLPLGSVTCQLGDLPAGASRVLAITVRVQPDLACTTRLRNRATVASTTGEPAPDPHPNAAQTDTDLRCRGSLKLTKTALDYTPVAGEELTYALTLKNEGPSTAYGVRLRDVLPAGMSYKLDSRGCGQALFGAGCALGDLAAGESLSLDIVVTVLPDATCGATLANTATASSTTAATVQASADVVVDCVSDLRVTKFGKPDDVVQAGQNLEYTIWVDNLGPSFADHVALKDLLQTSGVFDVVGVNSDRDAGCRSEPDPDSDAEPFFAPPTDGEVDDVNRRYQLDCTLLDRLAVLKADGPPNSGRWILNVTVKSDKAQSLNNTAAALSASEDPDPSNNRSEVIQHSLIDVADLSISKTDYPDCDDSRPWPGNFCDMNGGGDTVVPAGSTGDPDDPDDRSSFHYRVDVKNHGPSRATGVVMTDSLPKELQVMRVRMTPNVGSCSTVQGTLGQPVVTCNLGNMEDDDAIAIDIFVYVPPGVPHDSLLWNEASVNSDALEPNNDNNRTRSSTHIIGVTDLSITKADSPDPAVAGGPLSYRLTVRNDGPSVARDVWVEDPLPAELEAISADVIGVTDELCSIDPNGPDGRDVVSCRLGDLDPGQTREILIQSRVRDDVVPAEDADQCVSFHNVATVGSDTKDPEDDNNRNASQTAGGQTTVCAQADLKLTKTSMPEKVKAGEQKKYTLTVENLGPSDASGVTIWDLLPDEATYEVDTNGAMCTQPANLAGFRAAMNTALEVPNPSGPDTAMGLASFVLDSASNMLSYAVFVNDMTSPITAAHIHTGAAGATGPVLVGLYAGAPPVFDESRPLVGMVQLTPAQAAAIQANPQNHYVNVHTSQNPAGEIRAQLARALQRPMECEIGPLMAGATRSFDFFAKIDPNTAAGTTITNVAMVKADSPPDTNPSNNADFSKNYVESLADLKVTKFGKPDDQVRAGETLTYTVIVDNLGPSAARGVALKDLLQSSGKFEVRGVTSDRPASCISLPAPAGGGFTIPPERGAVTGVANRYQLDCTLDAPLGVLEAAGFPNPGRWILTLRVRANEDQSLNNVADVLSEAEDPDPSNNHAIVEHDISEVADLKMDKKAPSMVVAGESLVWTLIVKNTGPSTAENVIAYDRLPSGIVVTRATAQGGHCNTGAPGSFQDRLICTLGTMRPNEERTITIEADVEAGLADGTLLENDAFVLSDAFDDDNSDNADYEITRVKSVAALAVVKSSNRDDAADNGDDAQGPALAGTVIEYTIRVSNAGSSDAAEVLVVDQLPEGTSFQSATVTEGSGTCQGLPTGEVKCQLGTLEAEHAVEIVIRALVDPDYDCTVDQLYNTVEVTSPSDADGASTELYTEVACRADLLIQKWSDPVKVYAGEQKKYTVRVTNLGPSEAENVVVVDTLPTEVDYEIDTKLCQVALGEPDVVTCQAGTLPPGGTWQVEIFARVDADTPPGTVIVNEAEVSSSTPDANEANNIAESENLVLQKADLKVRKFGKPDASVRAGEILTYTVIVDNLGPSWADGVALKDVLQTSGTFDLIDVISDRAASCQLLPAGTLPVPLALAADPWPPVDPPLAFGVDPVTGLKNVRNRLELDCTLDDPLATLAADGPPNSGRWILTMRLRAAQTQSVNNVAEVLSAALDPDRSNNSAFVEHELSDVADLSVSKTQVTEAGVLVNPPTIVAGTPIWYKIVVRNTGPSDAENVLLFDRLPPGITVTGVTIDGAPAQAGEGVGACTTGQAGSAIDQLKCGLGTLRVSQSKTVTIRADVSAWVPEGAKLENDAFVTSGTFDDDDTDNYSHVITMVMAEADLWVRKTGDPSPLKAGVFTSYDIEFRNDGPSAARDVVLRDRLPFTFDLISAYVEDGSPVSDSATCFQRTEDPALADELTCELGDLGPGQGGKVVVLVFIQTGTPAGLHTNTAWIESDTTDPEDDNNLSTFDTTVAPMADLLVEKWSDPVKVNAGEQKKYTVRVTNLGPSDAVNVVMTDTLPQEVDYEIDTARCSVARNAGANGEDVVTCRYGTLKPGQSRSVDIYALVQPGTAPGIFITNRAEVSSDTPEGINASNNTAYADNFVLHEADLKVTKFGKRDGNVRAEDVLTYTVLVDNLGPSFAWNPQLKDLLQTSGKFELLDLHSNRAATCRVLKAGANPSTVNLAATAWPIVAPLPSLPAVGDIDQRVEVSCDLGDTLEVLDPSAGPPNDGRWILTMRVRARQAQSVNNVASVTNWVPIEGDLNGGNLATDPDPSNNMAMVEHEITDLADLSVTKTALGQNVTGCLNDQAQISNQADRVTAGLELVYTIEVLNHGPSNAENVVLTDRLPPGVTVIGGMIDGSAAQFATGCVTGKAGSAADKLTCGLPLMLGDTSPSKHTITVRVKVDPGLSAGTILENDVTVGSDVLDADQSDNRAFNLTTVNTSADLRLLKSDDPDPVVAGERLRYTLAVTNDGPSISRNVHVYDDLPEEVRFESAIGATCLEDPVSPGDLVCQLGDMQPGETRYVYLVVQVSVDAPMLITNTAVAQSRYTDDTPNPFADATSEGEGADQVLNDLGTPDPCPNDNDDLEDTTVIRETDPFIMKSDLSDPVIAGKEARFLLMFGNNGPSTASQVAVTDLLPDGFMFDRCEPLDPNDAVSCTVADSDGNAGNGNDMRRVTLTQILSKNSVVWTSTTAQEANRLQPGESFAFVIVADVNPGYLLDGQTDGGTGGACKASADASGYLFWGHDRATIASANNANPPVKEVDTNANNNFDDECTRVNAEADLEIEKTDVFGDAASDPGNYFLECDPVQPGGMITYDLTITNHGMSDSAQVQVTDWLPLDGVAHDPNQVLVLEQLADGSYAEVTGARIEKRDDGRITVIVGNSAARKGTRAGQAQLGRLNAGAVTRLRIQVMVLLSAECGARLENRAEVTTIQGPPATWPLTGQTPTADPNPSNNADSETTTVECPAVTVRKTVSYDGTCPGRDVRTVVDTGKNVTFCFEITNTGTTYLDTIRITDTLRTNMGTSVIFTDLITHGEDPKAPVAPGETVLRQVTVPPLTDMCGTVTNSVAVTAVPVNRGRTVYPCLSPVAAEDELLLDVPCGGADQRLALPALNPDDCETLLQVQNVGDQPTKAILVIWGEAGACPPQAAGPLKMECTGLLAPGSAWTFPSSRIPPGSRSAIAYSVNAIDQIKTPQGNTLPFADVACRWLFEAIVGSDAQWIQFDQAYRTGGTYLGPFGSNGEQLELDFGAHPGEPLAITVNRTCPDPIDPNRNVSAAYAGISSERLGIYDPEYGGYAYYAPLVFANKGGLSTMIWIQNLGIECSSIEIWFKGQDNCLRPILGDILAMAPGESIYFDPNTVVGPDWLGSAWIRSSQPMAIVVDSLGPNHFASYIGVPADSDDAGFSLGSMVNYAPLIYSEYQGWDSAIQVQNLSGTTAAKVKVYFLDRSGDVITTLVDWICPRGSQTYFLPVISGLPGNWVGHARVESQDWWTPGTAPIDAPRIHSVVLLEKWADPARSERREAVAYNALTEQVSFDWQVGKAAGGTQSGSAVLAVPLVAKGNRGITSELAVTNLVTKPGFTDFAIFLFDQNGLLDHVCQKLHEQQVEYVDMNTWGWVPNRFMGSAVISATFWEHEVFDPVGGFQRNLVGLGGVAVERIGGTQGGPDVSGDESKAFEMIPIFDQFRATKQPDCGP